MKPKVAQEGAKSTDLPKEFGAFKEVEGNKAVIDLEKLRQHNIFFATQFVTAQSLIQLALFLFTNREIFSC